MTTDEKLNWLRQEDQSTRQWINKLSTDINAAFGKLERRLIALEEKMK